MPSLREVQRAFVADVFTGQSHSLGRDIVAQTFPGERLLQIYRNNMYLSLTEVMRAVFPVISRLVGEGFFRYLSHEFVNHFPSRSGNIQHFGSHLPAFLETFEPAAELPYLPDVGRLEWAWHEVYNAAEHAPFSPHRLARIPPNRFGELRFALHPASRMLESDFPILRIWEVNQEHWQGERSVDLSEGGDRLVLVRDQLDVSILRLEPGPFQLVRALAGGATLEAAVTEIADPGFDLQRWLQHFVQHGIVVDVQL